MATASSSSWTLAAVVKEEEEEEDRRSEGRNWAEMPRDSLLLVLEKMHPVDVLRGAELVCRPWHRAARDEPSLWRRIDFRRRQVDDSSHRSLHLMAYAAILRSRGRCETFWGEGVVDDVVISVLENSALSLKSLRIISCETIDDSLSVDIPKFTMLVELEISNCRPNTFSSTCIAAGNSCLHLKRFRLSSPQFHGWRRLWIDCEVQGIARMRGLRSLQLFAQTTSTSGMASILDSCTQLESLDIHHCFNVKMGDEMVARCSRFETLKLPCDSTDDYDLEFSAPM